MRSPAQYLRVDVFLRDESKTKTGAERTLSLTVAVVSAVDFLGLVLKGHPCFKRGSLSLGRQLVRRLQGCCKRTLTRESLRHYACFTPTRPKRIDIIGRVLFRFACLDGLLLFHVCPSSLPYMAVQKLNQPSFHVEKQFTNRLKLSLIHI